MKYILVILCLISIPNEMDSARILAVFLFPAYSHQIIFQRIWKELALKGHEVTVLTTDPLKDPTLPNLREIDLHFSYKSLENIRQEMSESTWFGINAIRKMGEIINKLTEQQLALPEIQEIITNRTETFDLVIVEWIFPTTYAFSTRFKCPIIGIHSIDVPHVFHYAIGNPIHPILYPSILLNYPEELNFLQRVTSTIFSISLSLLFHLEIFPTATELSRKYIDINAPSSSELSRNPSLILVNKNPFFSYIRPNLPIVIEYSNLHLKPAKPLPKHIQEFLDDAEYGAIYFSLGSNIQSSQLSDNLKQLLLDTFAELPYRILWKYETGNLSGLSRNVKMEKWLPQQDILGHKNIKLFIMQGGFQSLEESISKRVPVIGIPFVIDQPQNMKIVTKLGIGLTLEKGTITKNSLKAAIQEIIENPTYRKKITEVADILDDQPMKPLEKVVWWIEHTLRHNGTKYMKSTRGDLPWYQFIFLDIILFMLSVIVLLIFAFVKFFNLVNGVIRKRKLKEQ